MKSKKNWRRKTPRIALGTEWTPRYTQEMLDDIQKASDKFLEFMFETDLPSFQAAFIMSQAMQSVIAESIPNKRTHVICMLSMSAHFTKCAHEYTAIHSSTISIMDVQGYYNLRQSFLNMQVDYDNVPGFHGVEKLRFDNRVN